MAWFRLISAAFDSSVWPYTRPVPLSQVSPYTAEFFWRIMSDAEVARLRGLICSLRLFFGTFGSGIANQTWHTSEKNRKNKRYCHYITANQAQLKPPHYLGFYSALLQGGNLLLFFGSSPPICRGWKAIYCQTQKCPSQFSILPYSHSKLN